MGGQIENVGDPCGHPLSWLFLTQYYPPEVGSPQVRLPAVAKELVRRGDRVRILTALPNYPTGRIFDGYRGRFVCRETRDSLAVLRMWVYPANGNRARARLANYLSFTLTAAVAALLAERPDVLLIEGQPLSLGIIGLLLRAAKGVPYVFHIPDLQTEVATELGFLSPWSPLVQAARTLQTRILRGAWRVSTATDSFRDHLANSGARNHIAVLKNGADPDELRPLPVSDRVVAELGLAGKKVFLYVGTQAHYHGLETVIEAAALLRERRDLTFVLAGDGPVRSSLIELARSRGLSNVQFPGTWPYARLADLYSVARASLATLKDMPVARAMRLHKIFPSLSCGVPLVHAGEGEGADLIRRHGCGIVVPAEAPGPFADAVRQFADDDAYRDVASRAGRSLIEELYSWDHLVGEWLTELSLRDLRSTTAQKRKGKS